MPNELDPSDVYPPANLPPGASQWGRSIQGDVTKLKSAVTVHEQMLANANRGTASSLATLAQSIQSLRGVINAVDFEYRPPVGSTLSTSMATPIIAFNLPAPSIPPVTGEYDGRFFVVTASASVPAVFTGASNSLTGTLETFGSSNWGAVTPPLTYSSGQVTYTQTVYSAGVTPPEGSEPPTIEDIRLLLSFTNGTTTPVVNPNVTVSGVVVYFKTRYAA